MQMKLSAHKKCMQIFSPLLSNAWSNDAIFLETEVFVGNQQKFGCEGVSLIACVRDWNSCEW